MVRFPANWLGLMGFGVAFAVAPRVALGAPVCGTVEDFNAYMADNAAYSEDVTLTFDVVGVNPADFHNGKGSLAQMRNTQCNGGQQDAVIKVYGTSEPLNTSHLPGTLKMEYGNQCCGLADCGEKWADPNSSAVIFQNGSESCKVTMWIKPDAVGYKLECNVGTFEALGDNDEKNVVNQITVLNYLLPDGGDTWTLGNATATNVQVCYEVTGTPVASITVPVAEDVTVAPSSPTTVFADVTDLAVEAADHEAYLKFVVPPIPGKVTKALLFMHTRPESYANGSGGEVHPVSSSAWSETTLTYAAKPPADPTSLGRIGPAEADQTVSLDLGSVITGPGTYSFAVISPATDTNGTHFYSKEGSATSAAYLKLSYETVDGDGDGTPDGPDCNDADVNVHPGVSEQCNGVDDNCDGQVDETCPGGSGSGGSGSGWGSGGSFAGSGGGAERGRAEKGDAGCAFQNQPTGNAWLLAVLAGLALGFRRRRI
jgi:hypothetical protein